MFFIKNFISELAGKYRKLPIFQELDSLELFKKNAQVEKTYFRWFYAQNNLKSLISMLREVKADENPDSYNKQFFLSF